MRIIELLIDDEAIDGQFIGVDGVALVKRPAHEETWLAFNEDKKRKNIYETLTEEQLRELGILMGELGEKDGDLENEGYEIVKVTKIKGNHKFIDVNSDPNAPSAYDYAGARIRYKYVGPRDNKNRPFCAEMLAANRVYRREDIEEMSNKIVNPISRGQYYSIFQWRGSWNCRHEWVELIYKPVDSRQGVAQSRILTNADRKRNLIGQQTLIQEPTETLATANAKAMRKGFTTQDFKMIGTLQGQGLYDNIDEARVVANVMGCNGKVHEHKVDGQTYWMPCDHPKTEMAETYNDYPKAASEAACKVLRWIEEHGREEVEGMGTTGLARANQLCKREGISEETIARMAAFERHRKNKEINPEFKSTPWKDNGYVAWLGWGNDQGIEWAQRKLLEIREEKLAYDVKSLEPYTNETGKTISEQMELEGACWPGYEAIGTKIKDGKEVPNCVPVKQSKEFSLKAFSFNDEKMEITGAAIVPNKMIIRHNALGEEYYVYFSERTVRKLSQKFMKDKLMDATNIEHTNQKAEDTYVVESWVSNDEYMDKAKSLGLDYPKGTWVITMKTDNPKVWKDIKSGKYEGFSVEGYFSEKLVFTKEDHLLGGIKNIINNISND